MQDPRHRNKFHETHSLSDFIAAYVEDYTLGLKAVDMDALGRAISAIQAAADAGKRIYAIGNGGSTAVADHLCCDFTKGTDVAGHPPLATQSFGAAAALVSAIANDFGYEQIFSKQVGYYCKPQDVLIAISSSGNSGNIVAALEEARQREVLTIGLSGFSGGKLAEMADISLYVPVHNYGVVEDCHQSLMHVIAQVIACRREEKVSW
jgi:phosphoheptose isomerase